MVSSALGKDGNGVCDAGEFEFTELERWTFDVGCCLDGILPIDPKIVLLVIVKKTKKERDNQDILRNDKDITFLFRRRLHALAV